MLRIAGAAAFAPTVADGGCPRHHGHASRIVRRIPAGQPIAREVIVDDVTIWASPGVVADPGRPDLGEIATLTVSYSVTLQAGDPHDGAEPVDAILSALLARGFALSDSARPADLVELPVLTGWSAALRGRGRHESLEVGTPTEVFYRGDLGARPPVGWLDSARRRALLVVLACSGVDLAGRDRTEQIRAAQAAGRAVAAQLRIR